MKVKLMTDDYLSMNAMLHLRFPSYGASGHKWAQVVNDLGHTDVLDYGCGKGTLAKALGREIKEFDPAIPGKNLQPEPADLVVCTDVLEHIEPDFLDNVLGNIHYLCKKEALFVVATRPAHKTLSDGRNAHLIVEPVGWWRNKISKRFVIKFEQPDVNHEGDFLMLCEAR